MNKSAEYCTNTAKIKSYLKFNSLPVPPGQLYNYVLEKGCMYFNENGTDTRTMLQSCTRSCSGNSNVRVHSSLGTKAVLRKLKEINWLTQGLKQYSALSNKAF